MLWADALLHSAPSNERRLCALVEATAVCIACRVSCVAAACMTGDVNTAVCLSVSSRVVLCEDYTLVAAASWSLKYRREPYVISTLTSHVPRIYRRVVLSRSPSASLSLCMCVCYPHVLIKQASEQ